MKKRIFSILIALALCLTLLPATAWAGSTEDDEETETTAAMTVCGNAWEESTYAKTADGVVSKDASESDYNIYWDADTATLTLNNAEISVKDMDAISAAVETLTIKLIGENTITAEHTKGVKNETGAENLSAISNSGEIVIQPEGDNASLTIEVSQTGTLSSSKVAGIYTGTGLTNSATLSIEVTANDNIACSGTLSGIEGGAYENGKGLLSSAFLKNSGDITIQVENKSLSAWYGAYAYAVLLYGGALENSGTLNVTVSATNGDAYGLRGTATTELWKNQGKIVSNVTAYGGNYDNFSSDTYTASNHACAISIVTTRGKAQFINIGIMELTAANYGKNLYYEYAMGMELDAGGTEPVLLDNSGTISVKALEGCTYGIDLISYNSDAKLVNSGNMDVVATTDGHNRSWNADEPDYAYASGISFEQTTSGSTGQYKTELVLKSESFLSVSAHAVEGIEDEEDITFDLCQAIQLQKIYYYDPNYGEDLPQEITIADDLVIQEGGEQFTVFLEDYVDYGMWVYINSIGTDPDNEGPSKTVIIVPKLTGEVTITGTAQVGQTLTAETSGIPEGVSGSYQWQSCGTADGEFTDIDGAVEAAYTLTSSDTGKYIRVVITPVADSGYAGTLTATTTAAVSMPYIPPVTPTYPPAVEDTENGTVSVVPATPQQGGTVTVTPSPDKGYETASITVTDRNGNPVAVTDNGDGTFRFTQPAGKVTISVTYVCDGLTDNCASYHLADVDTSAWYHLAVDFVMEKGLMSGYGNGSFGPNNTLTRAELAQILYNKDKRPAVTGNNAFIDVADGAWYADAVLWAGKNGIIEGYNGLFAPDDPITREQLAVMLWRYAGCPAASGRKLDFIDADRVSPWALEAMLWATENGVMNGYGGVLDPGGTATRAEAAQMLKNFIENI